MSKTTTRKRRATRTDGEATRARILAVAGERFAASGFADTTSKDIAAEAEVDLASINYHFRDRSGLYQAVLTEAHRRIADLHDLEQLVASDGPAQDKLKNLIRFLLGGRSGQVQWPMVVLGREIISPSSHLHVLQTQEVLPKLQVILPVISEITAIPLDHPALLRCLPCIAAPCAAFVLLGRSATPIGEKIFEAPFEELVAHLHSYAIGGLEAISRSFRASSG
ncbi:TetR/AcrR family transcriptional regulator [Paracoccus aestuariivivens]|uniref:DUF1956 domain-containing protein n=1 Tax=Paracoccus aestuariivivens TaxID=1820333 RepID=A0A6L6JCW0_9RHOB|nr:TetR/AcrR family transcriptional regulator [Paracoccus aestuariivivens]MTH78497.1 DUF1956 domain-containing protein [Paracoccus aestuariivivens]